MDNPEKLATSSKQDEDKQNKNTTHYVFKDTFMTVASTCVLFQKRTL